jgi:CheY-like chemotaxis protein
VAVTTRQVQQRLALPPRPDIILIDVHIVGDQSGLDVARWLRQQPTLQHTLRILHTSADPEMIQQQSPDDQLFHAIISKPVPLHSLIEQLARLLQQSR